MLGGMLKNSEQISKRQKKEGRVENLKKVLEKCQPLFITDKKQKEVEEKMEEEMEEEDEEEMEEEEV